MIWPRKTKDAAKLVAPPWHKDEVAAPIPGALATVAVPERLSVAVLGMEPLGTAVALRLVHAGFSPIGFDARPGKAARAVARGIVMAGGLAQAASVATVAIAVLPSAEALLQLSAQLRQCPDRQIRYVIDLSSLSTCTKICAADALQAIGITLLDCSVIGTSAQIYDGDVLVCASGPKPAIEHLRPVLAGFSRRVEEVGELGAATKMKAITSHLGMLHNAAPQKR
ncbi:NAD(P)-binding domain-containing protein [Mycobacterium stomatepiae]|uniref:6-phosphogluconate dehydrogenase NADP-binding domain-containing protein n=1 Tax=Mycobacterium stomatepiae TaxID=470076 RepID=A0A7I7QH54_9MYCO|nr:NAD(P)-binding domain-containing protein [Mycobacterium stomatepiae]MCV7166154.1 NAD(P)-dependent oxidoreductase [Mycobacterium stomatepiae]BBY25665.1 hypothetical protein MSTO_58700 [Mycobacterium stomatepiae]